ncbi:glycosyltransferase family 2 protein [Intrasporangium sp. YIM S08009]|uniref:glycosyltransferase family 2 protein n=1 Tax=Intrasporangium zincisolvens TaxID=3080018 RepID=UPI002B056BCE|nr:glycosyltransferase [Intrasporangium sp. YIM S08009]
MSSVSVVIPCYRYGHFLEAAVRSVTDDQPGVDVRVLIVDDASPDDSAEVARRIASRRPEVEVVVHDTNRGNIATFNEGLLEWADGDYTLLMSADDRATPGALARARDLLDAHPGVGFVYGRALYVRDGEPLPAARTRVRGWSIWSGQEWLLQRFRQAENPITSPEIIVRTSLQHRAGGYDPGLPKAADMEMFMRLAAHADVGFIRGVDQAYYRLHGENMHTTVTSLMDLLQRRSVFEVVLERYGDAVEDPERLSVLVHRQLAREALWAAGRVHDLGRFRRTELGRRLLGGGSQGTGEDVGPLLEFAQDCWPDIRREALYRTLATRSRLGPRDLQFMVNQKGQWWLRRRSWKYRGV